MEQASWLLNSSIGEYTDIILAHLGLANYSVMEWLDNTFVPILVSLLTIGTLIGMSPLRVLDEHKFPQILAVYLRKLVLYAGAGLIGSALLSGYFYTLLYRSEASSVFVKTWLQSLGRQSLFPSMLGLFFAGSGRLIQARYATPALSSLRRRMRFEQEVDRLSDIREEAEKYVEKSFIPSTHYKPGFVFVGLDKDNQPIYISIKTWYEVHVQIIGPSRYGKGVEMGIQVEQSILRGDTVFAIDPKPDEWLPHVMYQAAVRAGRKFYYLALHDEGIGSWAPFVGSTYRNALARLETAFGLQFTGNPGTDYYKSQERRELIRMFQKTRDLEPLLNSFVDREDSRIVAELQRWREIRSLRPKKGTGFNVERALLE
ncbi:MAG: type IV secretory system conjugative DNA transfer family protein, partial [Pseudobdellovibrionaceae bacterium]|nr:type IV secretory system conjugative DNA transfer family protein [Pseudobdellovibrionaceae bacterium]